MKYPKLFDKQPQINKPFLAELEKRGLIVSAKSTHKSERRVAEVTNPTAGEVIGYSLLAKKFRDGEISQFDARMLLVIESARAKGPRDTHVSRLASNAFTTDKEQVLSKVESWARIQAKRK